MSGFERVHVIGGGGSGKTTLARKLGAKTGFPVFELDMGAELDPDAPRWISEGIYLYDVERVLDRADAIVWMDLSKWIALRRIVTRHVKLTVLRKNAHRGVTKLLRYVWHQRQYYTSVAREPTGPTDWDANSRAQTVKVLGPRSEKVVHLRSPRAVRSWLRAVR